MFILKTIFWLSLVVLVLPTDASQQQEFGRKARAAVYHIATFCDRNARACETGSHYWQIFKNKADYGLQLAFDLIVQRPELRDADSGRTRRNAAGRYDRGNLRSNDLVPAWRGTPPDRGL